MMGFILSIIAYILFPIVAVLNFVVVTWKFMEAKGFLGAANDFWLQNALEIDVWSNWHFRTFWNASCRKRGGYHFGRSDETISSALGKNQRNNALSIFGWFIVIFLYVIDYKYWGKGGHCLNSIKEF